MSISVSETSRTSNHSPAEHLGYDLHVDY